MFAGFSADHFRKKLPIFSNFFDHFTNGFVFFGRPDFSVDSKLGESSVAMEALVLIAISHESGDGGPFFGVFLIKFDKFVILIGAPGFDFSLFSVGVFMLDLELETFAILPGYGNNILSFHFFYFFIFIIEVGYKHDKYDSEI